MGVGSCGSLLLAAWSIPAAALRPQAGATHYTSCIFAPSSQAVPTDWESMHVNVGELAEQRPCVDYRRCPSGQWQPTGMAWQVGCGLNFKSNMPPSWATLAQHNCTAEQNGPEVIDTSLSHEETIPSKGNSSSFQGLIFHLEEELLEGGNGLAIPLRSPLCLTESGSVVPVPVSALILWTALSQDLSADAQDLGEHGDRHSPMEAVWAPGCHRAVL